MTQPELEALRGALGEIDREIIRLVGKRQQLVREIGEWKDRDVRAIRDFAQERRVLERARLAAADVGVDPALAERLLTTLIESSLTSQEQQRVTSVLGGAGRRALVIGGAGRMGGWFVRFLAAQGFSVEIADPAAPAGSPACRTDWRSGPLDQDLLIVAAPLRATAEILQEIATRKPRGIVCDIGSVKSPLQPALEALVRTGVKVTSLHPLFGPDTELLAGRHVVLVDLGSAEANQAARDLFAPTMAEVLTMDLASHDRTMAYILGLSHALNVAFSRVLARSGRSRKELDRLSSTTFSRQLAVAAPVAQENPRLYFEIQSLNEYGPAVLDRLRDAISEIREAVRAGREEHFVEIMDSAREWMR